MKIFNFLQHTLQANKIVFTVFLVFTFAGLSAQIIGLEPLSTNPILTTKHKAEVEKYFQKDLFPHGKSVYFQYDTLPLPFYDDFSSNRFLNHDTSKYIGLTKDSVKYWRIAGITNQPDTLWYVFNQPDSFFVNGSVIDSIQVSEESAIEIELLDTVVNPYKVKDIILAYRYQPKLVIVNGNPVKQSANVDGKLKNIFKHFYVAPHQTWDKSLWIDENVYLNQHMPVGPPTIGVVTFDGLNRIGMPYDFSNPSSYGVADLLTSKPLKLGNLSPSDSVYISFFYQAQGLGYFPAAKDSIALEFYSVDDDKWNWAWSRKGEQIDTFKQVMVPILNPIYYKDGFQFRFKNYATLSSNKDHWMIDYVRLDKNRNLNDTTINDVAIVTAPPSILRNYKQMPYNQFKQEEVNQKWAMQLINLHSQNKCIAYQHTFYLRNKIQNELDSLTTYPLDNIPGPYDTSCVRPVYTDGYDKNFRHNAPAFSYQFNTNWPGTTGYPAGVPFKDSMEFYVHHKLIHFVDTINSVQTTDYNPHNDSAFYYQNFYNYYAYDDGTAEKSLFLGSTGEIAYEFELNFKDTLRAVQFYFNPQLQSIENNIFELRIYKTLSNTSTDTLYAQASLNPAYMPSANNFFTTYILNRPVPLSAGKFYVGWRQNSIFKMNVGFDRNTDLRDKIFYKTIGQWEDFTEAIPDGGCLMIRPVLGKPVTPEMFLSIAPEIPPGDKATINIYPNPSTGIVNFELINIPAQNLTLSVLDMTGKMIACYKNIETTSINLSDLNSGIYFLKFESSNKETIVKKLILSSR